MVASGRQTAILIPSQAKPSLNWLHLPGIDPQKTGLASKILLASRKIP